MAPTARPARIAMAPANRTSLRRRRNQDLPVEQRVGQAGRCDLPWLPRGSASELRRVRARQSQRKLYQLPQHPRHPQRPNRGCAAQDARTACVATWAWRTSLYIRSSGRGSGPRLRVPGAPRYRLLFAGLFSGWGIWSSGWGLVRGRTMMSMRRFWLRPSVVSLDATGWNSAKPEADMR